MAAVGTVFQLAVESLSAAGASASLSPTSAPGAAADLGSRQAATTTSSAPQVPTEGGGDSRWNQTCIACGATCIACGIGFTLPGFESAAEQREHFKTDWHRYNVKRRLHNQPPASEEQFAALIKDNQDEVSSISGSSSGSDDPDDEDEEAGPSRQQRQKGLQLTTQLPQFVFQAADGRYLAVWRCLLFPDHALRGATASALADTAGQLANLRSLVTAPSPHWVIVMLRGGHFAAAVLKARTGTAAGARTLGVAAATGAAAGAGVGRHAGPDDMPFEVVAHKTFHRYVVRAKAGGKQSTKDGTGKYARSAGSRLRRYNELALERDIQELLASWAQHLASAQLVFVHAPSSNSKAIFGTTGNAGTPGAPTSPLMASDPRVRRVPFMTQRPTFSEIKRVARLLSSVFEVRPEQVVSPAEAAAAVAAAAAEEEAKREAAKAAKAEAEQQRRREEAAGSGSEDEASNGDAAQEEEEEEEDPALALHSAARAGDAELVSELLADGFDPTLRDGRGRTPYALSANKAVRDAFRRCMAEEPERCDWTAAEVPSALTSELEAAQAARKADKRARLRAKERERKATEAERKAAEEERKAAEAKAAAEAVDREIAQAAAEAAALSARLGNMRTAGPAPSKVGGAGAARGGAGSSSSAAAGGSRGTAGAKAGAGGGRGKARGPAQQPTQRPQQPPTPEELARRREVMAAAAEARMRALQQAATQQQLW